VTDAGFAQGLVGITLDGRYRLDAVLGEGGMGSVFRATQLAMDRKVAVKLLKPHLLSDEQALQRFAREARATLKVESPHAVKVLDFGVTPLRDYYMVLEYLDGRTVHRELEIDGPFAPARVAHVARQALAALGAAHAQGLIHRDVKPDNLLLMRVGNDADYTKILDFGVAKLMQGAAGNTSQLALTAAGMVFGTPEFMSPEQACGQTLDGRSDLYSLAATMYVMLTGTTLFQGKTAIELLTHHARTPAPHLDVARPELAAYPELDQLLQRCLAKHRSQRPESAAAMDALIRAIEPALTRPPGPRAPAAAPASPTPPPVIHTSSYFEALRDTDPAEARAPAAAPDPAAASASSPFSSSLPRIARPRRRLAMWLGGIAAASVLGLGFGFAMRGTSRSASMNESITSGADPVPDPPRAANGSTNGSANGAPSGTDPGGSAGGADPGGTTPEGARSGTVTPVRVAAPGERTTATAAPRAPRELEGGTGGSGRGGPRTPARNAAAEEHLRNAEEAFRAGNHLRQIAEADIALRADPRSARARYLVGDGLLKTGDLDRGCKYLRELKRNPMARDRARAGGCPGD
jgi:serine/threonine protein kinase